MLFGFGKAYKWGETKFVSQDRLTWDLIRKFSTEDFFTSFCDTFIVIFVESFQILNSSVWFHAQKDDQGI